jgi:di/tricarboxylate transporter
MFMLASVHVTLRMLYMHLCRLVLTLFAMYSLHHSSYRPMCHAVTMGGLLSMIGTSTNLVVEGLAMDAGEKPIGFFEPAYVAGPAGDLPSNIHYLTLQGQHCRAA